MSAGRVACGAAAAVVWLARVGTTTSAEKNAALPRLPFLIAICALGVSGCTTADIAGDLGVEPQLGFASDASDPALPDEVGVTPILASASTAEAGETEIAVASVAPSAFAGPAPDNPAAAAITPRKVAARSPELDALIARYAAHHEIPVELLRRVVNRESTFNPAARNGPYWGLMQILPATARTMGYRGEPAGLLDAETNLMYAGKYLRGAYLVADGNHDLAVRYYSRGYYYDAKRRGMLETTGLGKDRRRMRGS